MKTAGKTCFKCGQQLPLAAFYRHNRMADGHLNKCKECTKKDVTQHRSQHVDRFREYDRLRGAMPHRVELSARVSSSYRDRHPDRVAANNAVARAVRSGRLSKPLACWHCGSSIGVCGHHSSYSRDMRLAVTWLCQACHKAVHAVADQPQAQA